MAKTVQTSSGARGTKLVRATGIDSSGYGKRGTEEISNSGFKGSKGDLSNSISGGSVPSR